MSTESDPTAMGRDASREDPEVSEGRSEKKLPRWLRWVAGAGFVVFLLALGFAIWVARYLDPWARDLAVRRLTERTGHPVTIDSVRVQWWQGKMEVRGFQIANLPEYGDKPLLEIPELAVQLDLHDSSASHLHLNSLRLHLAQLNLVRDREGKLNLERFEKELRARAKPDSGEKWRFEFGGLDDLHLTLDKVFLSDLRKPGPARELSLGVQDEHVKDLKTKEDIEKWVGALAFRLAMQEAMRSGEKGGKSRWQLFLNGE